MFYGMKNVQRSQECRLKLVHLFVCWSVDLFVACGAPRPPFVRASCVSRRRVAGTGAVTGAGAGAGACRLRPALIFSATTRSALLAAGAR